MVLQRNKPIPVWGWADPGEKVSVSLVKTGANEKSLTVKADKDGKWRIDLPAKEAGGPYDLVVKGKRNSLTVGDVFIGEVWICSGQSNMAWTVNAVTNAEQEKQSADFPMIRHITIPRVISLKEEEDIKETPWVVAGPATVGDFSAVGFFFARELFKDLEVPIGLVNTSWGGTQIESWISREGVDSFDEFAGITAKLPASVEELNERRKKLLLDKISAEQGALPDASEARRFSEAAFDDSGWKSLTLPVVFDLQLLPYFDGTIWVRKTIDVPAFESNGPALLSLGVMADADETYINGVKIGETPLKNKMPRFYHIPANVLKSGKNTIAIRIRDTEGSGGFSGRADQMLLVQGQTQVALDGDWKYRVAEVIDNKQFTGPNHAATLLFNSMVAPLVPYALQGVIWYQGESNAGRAVQYRKSFPLMISDWRRKWKEEFPFLFVQLASFKAAGGNSETGSTWAELREAQTQTLALPKTGMAVINDIGERDDIHPRNKQDVGKRLALNAFKVAYGKDVLFSGPTFREMKKEGNAISVAFDHTGKGLVAGTDKYGYLKGFEVAGEDQKFHWAKAEISGDKVVVWADNVPNPVAVRYGWADDNLEANLFNAEGLPAQPFRTDDWKAVTAENKFK
ncbi:sialate O-acetylesterase [Ravibacter arvi]|uniref:Sialate O-acetylesterase n=2 Tax=Ravibacter arvi TaxID=2051041 RepID=A0ABP8LVL5_9BACT